MLVDFSFHASGCYFWFRFFPNESSFILKWNSCALHTLLNVYACGLFHFTKCQSAIISQWMAGLYFLRGTELCFKGSAALMNILFPHEITSCNNTALLPKDILLQTVFTHAHQNIHTPSLTHAIVFSCTHFLYSHTMQIQVDHLY